MIVRKNLLLGFLWVPVSWNRPDGRTKGNLCLHRRDLDQLLFLLTCLSVLEGAEGRYLWKKIAPPCVSNMTYFAENFHMNEILQILLRTGCIRIHKPMRLLLSVCCLLLSFPDPDNSWGHMSVPKISITDVTGHVSMRRQHDLFPTPT